MAAKSFILTLRCDGKRIASVETVPEGAEVLIGRSHQCGLRAPEEERSVSGLHAKLYWRGGALYIEDLGSRNGIIFKGDSVKKPRRVKHGDLFAIGNCALVCEGVNDKGGKKGRLYHQMEFLNGDRKGKMVDLRPRNPDEKKLTIGSDPGNDICLPDMLVSRHHATLCLREKNECWLQDNESRNGTFVNGEALHGKERLLKDGDKISIAYFDLRFLDRSVTHTRIFLFLKVTAVVLTLSVMAAVYVTWATWTLKAEDYLRQARQSASQERFDRARSALDAAALARDANEYRAQIDALETSLGRWTETYRRWQEAKQKLAQSDWGTARKDLDLLNSGIADAWAWNNAGASIQEQKNAEFSAAALHLYFDGQDVLKDSAAGIPEEQAARIAGVYDKLVAFRKQSAGQKKPLPYLEPLAQAMNRLAAEMSKALEGFRQVDACINALDAKNPDFEKLSVQLEQVSKEAVSNQALKRYAEQYLAPCQALEKTKQYILREIDAITRLEFNGGKPQPLPLPDKEICAKQSTLSDHRDKLERHHKEILEIAGNVETMILGLQAVGITATARGATLERAFSPETWQTVFTFDCFRKAPASARRVEPCGVFDEVVGIEYSFESLRALPNLYNGRCLHALKFRPCCVVAREALDRVDAFVAYLDSQKRWLKKNQLEAYLSQCQTIQRDRDALVQLLDQSRQPLRAQLVGRLMALYFQREGENLQEKRRQLAEDFKRLQKEEALLFSRYDEESEPARQIELRKQILALGLPGDIRVFSKWVQAFNGGSRE